MILGICVTHKRATVPILESLTFKSEEEALRRFVSLESVKECIIVQTCNRVEAYFVLDSADASESLLRFWGREVGVSEDIVRQVAELYYGRDALLHLMRLAAGLESMVVGEDQILGQIRKAFVASKNVGATGLFLDKVFMKAVNVGRRIRTETRINRGSVSISSAAVDLAEKSLGGLESVTAFVVGAGEAGTIVAEELRKRKVKRLIITNRTYSRGCELAGKVGGDAVKFQDVHRFIPKADLTFVAVDASEPIIKADALELAPKGHRKAQKVLVVDISQPRGVEQEVGSLLGFVLKNIDDLKEVVEGNLQRRWKEAERAKEIIVEELGRLEGQLGRSLAEPLVSRIFKKVEGIRGRELKKALRLMKGVDEEQRVVVEDLSRKLAERILKIPVERLREAALNHDGALLSAAEKLFNLEKSEK